MEPSVYDFDTCAAWLQAAIAVKKLQDRRFSMRGLARRLKLKSVSSLTMVVRGKRPLSFDLAHKLSAYLQLSKAEEMCLDALVKADRAASDDERRRHLAVAKKIRPSKSHVKYDIEAAELLARWYAVVILEMTRLAGFKADSARIAKQLGASVTRQMVDDAIGALRRHNLVAEDSGGTIRKVAEIVRSSVNIPSLAIRSFHKQVLARAHAAIDAQSIDERYFSSLTLAIPKGRVKVAGEMIARFRDEFMAEMAAEDAPPEEVYHLAMQFFRATAKR